MSKRALYTRILGDIGRLLIALAVLVSVPIELEVAQGNAQSGQGAAPSADAYRTSMAAADQKIAEEVKNHSELMKNLEYLTTQIGPRLTGSESMQKASDWTLQRFRDYGLEAHLETDQIAHAWYRGVDTAEIVSPIKRPVPIRSAGWSKATIGEVSAPVIFLGDLTLAQVEEQKDKLKGALVCLSKPASVTPPGEPADNAYDSLGPGRRPAPAEQPVASFADRRKINELVASSGATAILRDSGKANNLFNMGGAGMGGSRRAYEPSQVPTAFLAHEDYSLLYRLSQTGPVTMKISLQGTFSPGPMPASITVAEIKGSEHPDEHVIIGGHLDSWDLGQGALDNGTGSMAVLEAARALKALGWHPKRTLTFILFTGEEQGLVGSGLFIKNHKAELPKVDGVLIHDTGTGRVLSIALDGLWETAPLVSTLYQPLEDVFGLKSLETRSYGGSDHVPFVRAGVPAYFCVQAPAGYREAHHSQTDTFDKVIPEEVNQGAEVLAAWMWNVSELAQALPHHEPAKEQGPPGGAPAAARPAAAGAQQ